MQLSRLGWRWALVKKAHRVEIGCRVWGHLITIHPVSLSLHQGIASMFATRGDASAAVKVAKETHRGFNAAFAEPAVWATIFGPENSSLDLDGRNGMIKKPPEPVVWYTNLSTVDLAVDVPMCGVGRDGEPTRLNAAHKSAVLGSTVIVRRAGD